jgi:malonate decarboxylase gamma subunit
MMDWQTVAAQLFPGGHTITEADNFLSGSAQVDGKPVAVIGTTDHTPIGIEIALAQAQAILRTVREHPGRPILILVDTQGQRLRHRDEMLGINSYMAHLGKCVDLARREGHTVIGLVYDQALSGGFITSGLIASACYALPEATIRVMGLPAMARITKVPEERLTELAKDNPVFAPGHLGWRSGRRVDPRTGRCQGRGWAHGAWPGAGRPPDGAPGGAGGQGGQRCSPGMTWSG